MAKRQNNRQNKEFKLIQKGMYSRDRLTEGDFIDMNVIQHEKAKEFLKKYPDAVVGRIEWHTEKDKEFPLLKDQVPLTPLSFNFALPEKITMIELAIKSFNESNFEANVAVEFLSKINIWIKNAKGIQFFWL